MAAPELELFRCGRRALRLTMSACAKLWTSAQERAPDPWEGRAACKTCAIGRANAGQPAEPNAEAVELWRMVCPRCLRGADRLINGKHCTSCYNRNLEAKRGRNAKGGRPLLCDVLHTAVLNVSHGGDIRVVRLERVVSMTEAMVAHAKSERGSVAFGVPRVRWLGAEPEVPPGAESRLQTGVTG